MTDMLKGRLSALSQNLNGELSSATGFLHGKLTPPGIVVLQNKSAVPSATQQIITADAGYDGLAEVTVSPIPNNYGLITWNGTTLTVS